MSYKISLYTKPQTEFQVDADETVLAAAQRQGIDIPFSCGAGICTTCKGKVYEGSVEYRQASIEGLDPKNAKGEALFCTAYPTSNLVIDHPDLPPTFPPKRQFYRVLEQTGLAGHIVKVVLQLEPGQKLKFGAGQYLNLMDKTKRHPYSIASRPGLDSVELHIQTDRQPEVAQQILSLCQPGQSIEAYGPLGNAFLRAGQLKLILMAGGSGIAQIKSILDELQAENSSAEIYLYWGVRAQAYLYLDSYFKQIKLPNFHYIPVVSEDLKNWNGRKGLVHAAVCQDFNSLADFSAYLAGPFEMSYTAKTAFVEKGLRLCHLYSDAFAFEKT